MLRESAAQTARQMQPAQAVNYTHQKGPIINKVITPGYVAVSPYT